MNTKGPKLLKCLVGMFAAAIALGGHSSLAQDRVSIASGDWDDPSIWEPSGVPSDNAEASIDGGFTVDHAGMGTSNAKLRVGNQHGDKTDPSTLNITAGIISTSFNAVGAHQIATASGSGGVINVTGGTLRTTASGGGGIRVGNGDDSEGILNISLGAITTTGGIHLGTGGNATGKMTVSGGTVTTSTADAADASDAANVNFFVGGRVRSIHPRNGVFEQTGGVVEVGDDFYFRVGNGSLPAHNPNGTAVITGGEFIANVKVGREADVAENGGTGVLTIGPEANIKGRSLAWEISATGTLVFQLGADETFNPVDLTAAAAAAMGFTQFGATIRVDGSALPASGRFDPITLILWKEGHGPTEIDNAGFDFIGFGPGIVPELEWTDTGLRLNLVGR